jgi:hypothetical protein
MDGMAQTGFHNESRVSEVRVHARRLAKANRLMCWIGLLFEKVESVSSTNKAQSKIHKLNKVTEIKICGSMGYRTTEDMIFWLFRWISV